MNVYSNQKPNVGWTNHRDKLFEFVSLPAGYIGILSMVTVFPTYLIHVTSLLIVRWDQEAHLPINRIIFFNMKILELKPKEVFFMCDRFSLTAELPALSQHFQIGQVDFTYKARSHIIPTQQVSVIIAEKEHRKLEEHRWGLVPFWAKDAVHADSAVIHEKPAYRKMFSKHRCVIPCSEFYVWESKGKNKQSIRIQLKDKRMFGMAGLYEIWKDARGGEYRTCTVMTTVSNRLIYEYDERMPAILNERDIDAWLDPKMNEEPDFLQSLLKPYAPDRMRAYPELSRNRVPREKEEELIEEPPAKYVLLKK